MNPATIRIITAARIKNCKKREFILYDSEELEINREEKKFLID